MNHSSLLGITLCLLFGSSCKTTPAPSSPAPASLHGAAAGNATSASVSLAPELQRGKALLQSGNAMAAMKQFAYLRDHAQTPEDRDRAAIGLSMALQDSGNRGAALGALEPLPDLPATGTDAMKCILAGELYLHQKNFELARNWLVRGLEVEPGSLKRHRASGFFNLGKAFLGLDNLEDAKTAFSEAESIFAHHADETSVNQCRVILADIRRSLM